MRRPQGAEQDTFGWRVPVDNLDADVLPAEKHPGLRGAAYRTLARGRFNYLRADRVSPELVYPRSHREVIRNRTLGSRGEYTVHYLTEFRDEIVANERARENHAGPTLGSQVAHWLGEISPDVRVEPDAVGGTDFVRVRFGFGAGSGLTGSASYRPTHVGFGLTYTLPIVVALLTTPPGGMLLLENPEAHVHPRGQAALGVLMTRAVAGGVQILLETHSDHVLNGVRLAAKRGNEVIGLGLASWHDSLAVSVNRDPWRAPELMLQRLLVAEGPQGDLIDQEDDAICGTQRLNNTSNTTRHGLTPSANRSTFPEHRTSSGSTPTSGIRTSPSTHASERSS